MISFKNNIFFVLLPDFPVGTNTFVEKFIEKNNIDNIVKFIWENWKKTNKYRQIIFKDYSEEEIKILLKWNPPIIENSITKPMDLSNKFFNVKNGIRYTTNNSSEKKVIVNFIGNSAIYGHHLRDDETIPSQFSKHASTSLFAINHGAASMPVENMMNLLSSIYNNNEIFIISLSNFNMKEISKNFFENKNQIIDLRKEFKSKNSDDFFIDRTHFTSKGTNLIGKKIAEIIATKIYNNDSIKNLTFWNKELEKYELFLKKFKNNSTNNDSIVMNCNPFTKGHLFLIEKAAKKSSHLFIFVVEEDKSFFCFKDRFDLIKKGTNHIKNITLIPSGKFIISSRTLPGYFKKEIEQNKIIDSTMDLFWFGFVIARTLNIKKRWAGTEITDKITKQYNDQMRFLLPKYEIIFEEIKRKKKWKKPISASKVRELLSQKKFKKIRKIVPRTTFTFLQENFK